MRAAKKAGNFLLDHYEQFSTARLKNANKGLVTRYDVQAEQMIRKELRQHFSYPVLGEEIKSTEANQDNRLLWCVDPIDGTANFARHLPFFAVSIALLLTGTVQAGVIYQPYTRQCYYAECGKGAFVDGERISVSKKRMSLEAVLFVDHGYHADDLRRCVQVLQRLGGQLETRKLGTTAVELALLSQGSADAFICSGDEIWDYAAGILLVREAGGRVTDWQGNEITGESEFLFASNGMFHQHVVDRIRDLQMDDQDSHH